MFWFRLAASVDIKLSSIGTVLLIWRLWIFFFPPAVKTGFWVPKVAKVQFPVSENERRLHFLPLGTSASKILNHSAAEFPRPKYKNHKSSETLFRNYVSLLGYLQLITNMHFSRSDLESSYLLKWRNSINKKIMLFLSWSFYDFRLYFLIHC